MNDFLNSLNNIVSGLDPVSVFFGIFLVFFIYISFGFIDWIIEYIHQKIKQQNIEK